MGCSSNPHLVLSFSLLGPTCKVHLVYLIIFPFSGKDVVSDVSATMAASRDKMTGVLSNAVTSLHRRTGSGRVVIDKKVE